MHLGGRRQTKVEHRAFYLFFWGGGSPPKGRRAEIDPVDSVEEGVIGLFKHMDDTITLS